jgi:hypothetical protein
LSSAGPALAGRLPREPPSRGDRSWLQGMTAGLRARVDAERSLAQPWVAYPTDRNYNVGT